MGNGAELVFGDGGPDYVVRLKPLGDTAVSPLKPSVTIMQKWFGS